MSQRKTYVLDTSVLLHDPKGALKAFGDNIVVIPIIVINELDGHKNRLSKGYEAREVLRQIDVIREDGDILRGVETSEKGMIRIDMDGDDPKALPDGFDPAKADNIILLTAKRLTNSTPESEVVLVSKDTALRILAQGFGVKAEDYKRDKTIEVNRLYSGYGELTVPDDWISKIHGPTAEIAIEQNDPTFRDLPPNSCLQLIGQGSGKIALAVFKKRANVLRKVSKPHPDKNKSRGIQPRNIEQALAGAILNDPEIMLVTLSGKAGTGKSLMALNAGWRQVIEREKDFNHKVIDEHGGFQNQFDRILVFRPTREIGNELGFLPGSLAEKIAPWQRPTINNLRLIAQEEGKNSDFLENLIGGRIEILPINHIRGSTESRAFIIIDDAQNFTPHEIKAIITRVGQGSKVVITGDLVQIDVSFLDSESNGLAHVISRFPGKEIYGHLRLNKGERSELAELAADLL